MAEPHPPSNTMTRNLPQEILFFKILPRLPVKSLPNLMCVCKKWYLFLKSGAFATTYHHHVTNIDHQNHHKHLILSTNNRGRFSSIDCETPKDGLTAGHRLPIFLSCNDKMCILTSLHGLFCVGTANNYEYSDQCSGLSLWNPLTRNHKYLSRKGCHDKECYQTYEGIFALYYISSDDDYRLLRVTQYPSIYIYIYSLKSDSWRKVESTEDFQQRASEWNSSREQPTHILLNEKLYFLKQVDRGQGTFIRSYLVMRFDTKTEKFTEIAMPSFENQVTRCLGFMVIRGYIHFCVGILIEEENYMTNRPCYEIIELWKMDGNGDWTKVLAYGPISFFHGSQWSLLHLMRNGNMLIRNEGNIYVLDMEKHTKEMVFPCHPIELPYMYPEEPYRRNMGSNIPAIGKYIETTVSPNQYQVYVLKWFLTTNGLEWCTVKSWQEYDTFERAMCEKYGEDIIHHTGNDVELLALSQGGRKDHIYGIRSFEHVFARPPYSVCSLPTIEYVQSQLQIRELQTQIEMERKAREEMQDQIAKEREIQQKSLITMQAQISELMKRFGNHHGIPPNAS